MLYYIFALIFVSVSGSVIPSKREDVTISEAIVLATNTCKFTYPKEILSNLQECNIPLSSGSHTFDALRCSMFLDATIQLCSSNVQNSDEKEMPKLWNNKILRNITCTNTKQWITKGIPQLPEYKSKIDSILKSEGQCEILCAQDVIDSVDSNFFCKYVDWVNKALQTVVKTTSVSTSSDSPNITSNSDGTTSLKKAPMNSNTVVVTTKETQPSVSHNAETHDNVEESKKDNLPQNNDIPSAPTAEHPESTPVKNTETKPVSSNDPKTPTNAPIANNNDVPNQRTTSHIPNKVSENSFGNSLDNIEKPIVKEETEVKESDNNGNSIIPVGKQNNDEKISNKASQGNEGNIEDTNVDPDSADEDNAEDNVDRQGLEDGDGAADDDINDPSINNIDEKIDSFKPLLKTPERTPNLADESSAVVPKIDISSDEISDDNFFPFFMTIIVVVVILYVLYHNKNKVTKVVLGLIVEGRQSGRRRNSRTYAYRRLDTLEQAMSSKSTAPPSKIIY